MDNELTRRSVIRGGVGIAASMGIAATGACTSESGSPSQKQNSNVALPSYVPFDAVKPDLARSTDGVAAGYFQYPADPRRVITDTPATHPTTSLVQTAGPVNAVEKNRMWQEINKRIGAELKFNVAPTNYAAKLATTIAGSELPDLVQMVPMPQLPGVLGSKFQDLTEFLAGDAIKEYPMLAGIGTQAWRSTVYNGAIYGVPVPRGVVGNLMNVRTDVIRAKGFSTEISNGEEFLSLCRSVTDAKQNKWAFGGNPVTWVLPFVQEMVGAPNVWREEGGKFTHSYEAEETRRALEIVAGMWREGLFHPDSFTAGTKNLTWFGNGTSTLIGANYATWPSLLAAGKDVAGFEIGAIPPPKFDGGGLASKFLASGVFSFTAFAKASADRIRELLRVLNWLAAPFGTDEYLLRWYGIEGHDYTLSGTDPILTDTGRAERSIPSLYLVTADRPLYEAGNRESTAVQHRYQEQTVPKGVPLPTVGLYSDTQVTAGATLDKNMADTQSDIIQGRKTLADWDEAVRTWRSRGGDKIRQEYEAAFTEARNR